MKKVFSSSDGIFYDLDHFETVVNEDYDCYKEDGKILFKYRKNRINKELGDKVINIFLKESKKNNNQRAIAGGGIRIKQGNMTVSSVIVKSNIFGYYDKPTIKQKKFYKDIQVCRPASTNKKIAFDECADFYKIVNNIYEELAPYEYNLQKEEIKKSLVDIHATVFSTITTNYNFRTACHKDKGDFQNGLGVIVVLGGNFKGCYLGFPDYKICVSMMPGDIIIMDSHEYHCNTEIDCSDTNFRLSFVFYLRKNISMSRKLIE